MISDVFGWLKILVFQTMGMPTQWVRSWSLALALALSTAFFFVPYRYFPHRRVPAGAALAGALLAAVLWETAKQLFRLYILSFGVYDQVYGPLGRAGGPGHVRLLLRGGLHPGRRVRRRADEGRPGLTGLC